MINTLFFNNENAKLGKRTAMLSLPAGFTCPFAKDCKSCSNRETGKVTDGPDTQFRCYATTAECLFRNIRESRWNNFELLLKAKTVIAMAAVIEKSLLRKKNVKLVRFHQSGDFFSQAYFDAWLLVAQNHPEWTIYGYTKALPYWVRRLASIPANFKLVASRGGTHDELISMFKLRNVRVVLSEREARRKWKLPIDHDDSHVWNYDGDFAILIHGTQPAGSKAGKAWSKIVRHGRGGYKSDYFAHYDKGGKKTWKPAPVSKAQKKAAALAVVMNTKPFQLLPVRWSKNSKKVNA